jgi:hypothetical protein
VDQPLGSRYVLHELLGRGAMGQVFRGSVRGSGAAVAVKVLKPELVSDTEVVARFFRERSILTSIDHPNVAKVLDLVVEGETLGIVMELVEGQDLRRYLRARGTLPPGEAVWLAGQLLEGLAAVHAGGIVHRDVKPENVLTGMARGRMVLKLTDFGVSRLSYGASLTKMTSLIGTPEYMAPELADHDTATPAADLYSAGIVLYEMLAGRTPFAGGHPLAVLRRQVEQPPAPIPGVPAELWAQIGFLLAKDPRSRPASAVAALDRLAPLAGRLDRLPALPPMPDPAAMPGQTMGGRESGQTMTGREGDQTVTGPGSGQTVTGPGSGQTVLRARDRGQGPVTEPAPIVSGRAGHGRVRARRRRAALIALPAALVIVAAAAAAVVLTRSPHTASPAAASRTLATRQASLSPQPTRAASRTPAVQATSQAADPTPDPAPSHTQQANPAAGSAPSHSQQAMAGGTSVFSHDFGTHSSPNYVLAVLGQSEKVGQPIILFRTSSSDSAEDWRLSFKGSTADFYAGGLVDSAVASNYGCIPGNNFSSCDGQTAVAVNDPAFELEYAPNGMDSGLCMGVPSTAVQDEGVSLQPCGASARTVWIADIFGSSSTLFNGYVPLINGSDTDFTQPFVLTYPNGAYPTDVPRPQLVLLNLTGSSQGSPPGPALGTVGASQLWGA